MEVFNIYLIGGMGKFGIKHFDECNEWRKDLKCRLENCDSIYKVHVINPNDYYNFVNPCHDTEKEIMVFDLHKVRTSDLCICNFNDMYSLGSMAELAIAYDRNIPVVGLDENAQDLHPWQNEMVVKMCTNMDELVDYVVWYYLT